MLDRERFCIAQESLPSRAQQTDQLPYYVLPPPLLAGYPSPFRPRRMVPHMLLMSSLQLGHPVLFLILVEPDNPSPNPVCLFFHVLPNSWSRCGSAGKP
jgi:hypothetical protein